MQTVNVLQIEKLICRVTPDMGLQDFTNDERIVLKGMIFSRNKHWEEIYDQLWKNDNNRARIRLTAWPSEKKDFVVGKCIRFGMAECKQARVFEDSNMMSFDDIFESSNNCAIEAIEDNVDIDESLTVPIYDNDGFDDVEEIDVLCPDVFNMSNDFSCLKKFDFVTFESGCLRGGGLDGYFTDDDNGEYVIPGTQPRILDKSYFGFVAPEPVLSDRNFFACSRIDSTKVVTPHDFVHKYENELRDTKSAFFHTYDDLRSFEGDRGVIDYYLNPLFRVRPEYYQALELSKSFLHRKVDRIGLVFYFKALFDHPEVVYLDIVENYANHFIVVETMRCEVFRGSAFFKIDVKYQDHGIRVRFPSFLGSLRMHSLIDVVVFNDVVEKHCLFREADYRRAFKFFIAYYNARIDPCDYKILYYDQMDRYGYYNCRETDAVRDRCQQQAFVSSFFSCYYMNEELCDFCDGCGSFESWDRVGSWLSCGRMRCGHIVCFRCAQLCICVNIFSCPICRLKTRFKKCYDYDYLKNNAFRIFHKK